jgi:lysophospholipase L1-like esterase
VSSVLVHLPIFFRHIHRVRYPLFFSLVSPFVILVAVELAVRVLDPFGISHFEESARLWSAYVPDPELVFKLPAHTTGIYQGVTIATNALGLRERDIGPKEKDELRVLLLGDSITFGYGVPAEQTFGRKLESILKSRIGRPVLTVNAGIGGYNTVQESTFFEDHVGEIDPDVVTLLYLFNDIDSNHPPFNPRYQSVLYMGAPSQATLLLREKSWLVRLGLLAIRDPETDHAPRLDTSARGVKASLKALANIAALCRRRGIEFVTFFYREKNQAGDPFFDALFAEVSRVGAENGFLVTDTQTWWGDKARQSLTNSAVDWHPSARGHDILAAGMANVLLNAGAIAKDRP